MFMTAHGRSCLHQLSPELREPQQGLSPTPWSSDFRDPCKCGCGCEYVSVCIWSPGV